MSSALRLLIKQVLRIGILVGVTMALIWSLTPHDPTSFVARQQNVEANEPAVDPDRPAFMKGRVDEADYLRLRSEYLAERRGLPYGPLDNPRGKALRIMDQQEAGQRTARQRPSAANQWNPIGPAPIPNGQTTSRSDPVSGRTTAIAVHPTDPNIAYVGTAFGGVYRTLDGGTTWTPLLDTADSLAIGAIAIAPSNPEIVYVGTGEPQQSCDSYVGVGLYRIDNASTTATLTGPINPNVTTGIAGTKAFNAVAISEILVHPTDPATIFVSTMSGMAGMGCSYPPFNTIPQQSLLGVYRSTNATAALGSIAFSKIMVTSAGSVAPDTSGNRDISDIVFEPGNANVLLAWVLGSTAANDGGVWRTANALAATPTFSRTQATTLGFARGEFAINKVGATVNVVVATEEGTGGILRKSSNGGVTWPTTLSSLGATQVGFCGGQCWYDIAVALDPGNASIIYLGGSANGDPAISDHSSVLVKSTNGTAFSRIDTGLHADTHALAIAPSNSTVVYVGNDGGIWRSSDSGATWVSKNNTGFSATQFQSVAVHPTNRNFLIGGTQDNGTQWRKADGTWFRADLGDGGYALIDQNAADTTNVTMYHTYFNGASAMGFARVTNTADAIDDGWTLYGCGFSGATANGLACTASAILFYAPMALGPDNPNTLYFGSDRVYRSSNSGITMTVVSQQFASGVPVTTIGISPQDDNVRIVGTRDGKVYRTMTGANPMTDVTSASFPANPGSATRRFVSRAVIDPNNVNTAYVTFAYYAPAGQGVWKTTNLNVITPTWTASGNGLPSIPVNALVVDPADSNIVYAGTDIGVYQSTDGGANWSPFNTGLPRVAVFDLVLQNTNRVLRAATHGRGIYEYSLVTQKFIYLPLVLRNYTALTPLPTLLNADFDLGHVAWTESSTNFPGELLTMGDGIITPTAHSGAWLAWLGGIENEVSDLSQQLTVPNGTGPFYLYFRYQIASDETNCSQSTPSDTLTLRINNTQVDGIVVCNSFNTGANWIEFSFVPDLSAYAGQTITLHIRVTIDNTANTTSSVYLDSLHFSSTPPALKSTASGLRTLPAVDGAASDRRSTRSLNK